MYHVEYCAILKFQSSISSFKTRFCNVIFFPVHVLCTINHFWKQRCRVPLEDKKGHRSSISSPLQKSEQVAFPEIYSFFKTSIMIFWSTYFSSFHHSWKKKWGAMAILNHHKTSWDKFSNQIYDWILVFYKHGI